VGSEESFPSSDRSVLRVTDPFEEVPSGRNDEANVIEAVNPVLELVASQRLAGDHFVDVG
jgi:hypothetical protein